MPDVELPLVEGVRMNSWFSFPSGHTTSFFALAFVVSILFTKSQEPRDKRISTIVQITLFILAAIGGYSRIYLSQHFTLDVYAGILVGTLITIVCYTVFYRFDSQKWYNFRVFTKK